MRFTKLIYQISKLEISTKSKNKDGRASQTLCYTVTWVPTSTTRPLGIWK